MEEGLQTLGLSLLFSFSIRTFVAEARYIPSGSMEPTLQVNDRRVYVNGSPLKENYITVRPDYQWGPIQVPANYYLVLGDNCNDSYDSHYTQSNLQNGRSH